MATLYELLGVADNASEDEIKRAYRKAAMKWHPDRNAGREDAARAAFQEIKDAYAILSDAHQRAVYDAVFAEEMRRWQSEQEKREQERAEREAAEQAAAEARYRENVALAMRFADAGYNRDVLLGVLLGRDCDEEVAGRIADSVYALQQARRAETATEEDVSASDEAMPHDKESRGRNDKDHDKDHDNAATPAHDAPSAEPHEERNTRLFDTLWRGFFGLRS